MQGDADDAGGIHQRPAADAGRSHGANDSGLALALPGTAADVVRITNAGCLLLARAVLGSVRAGDDAAGGGEDDSRRQAAAREPGIGAWLKAAAAIDSGPRPAAFADRLRRDLVTPHPGGPAS